MSLRYAILSLLAHDPLSGYELMKLFDGSVGYFWHHSLRRDKLRVTDEKALDPRDHQGNA